MRLSLLLALLGAVVASAKFLPRNVVLGNEISVEDPSSEESDEVDGDLWAVLVAGSNGWYNYRHQADVAHSYHVLLEHGVSADKIIVLMYDDIAHNKANPYPGKLYNNPGKEDVYEGLIIDYKGKDVTPDNFLNVLKGNASGIRGGNGRVVESGPNDRIFVYFTDHGAVGLVSFPSEIMTVKTLNDGLTWMYKNKRYEKLVFYLEACESGSMFESVLTSKLNVYAVTASNGRESSWGTYCDNTLNLPCLGDLFSVSWMEDSDIEDLIKETVGQQFLIVKNHTDKSHVMHFGDLKIEKEPVGEFQGMEKKPRSLKRKNYIDQRNSVESWDVELQHLAALAKKTKNHEKLREIKREITAHIEERSRIRKVVKSIVLNVLEEQYEGGENGRKDWIKDERERVMATHIRRHGVDVDCLHDVQHSVNRECFNLAQESYALRYMYVFNNLCEITDANSIIEGIKDVCRRRL